jgi:hypothetical protein
MGKCASSKRYQMFLLCCVFFAWRIGFDYASTFQPERIVDSSPPYYDSAVKTASDDCGLLGSFFCGVSHNSSSAMDLRLSKRSTSLRYTNVPNIVTRSYDGAPSYDDIQHSFTSVDTLHVDNDDSGFCPSFSINNISSHYHHTGPK